MKRKILIVVLSFVLLFVSFIPVMNASSYSGTTITSEFTSIYFNTNETKENVVEKLSELDFVYDETLDLYYYNIYEVSIGGVSQSSIMAFKNEDNVYAIGLLFNGLYTIFGEEIPTTDNDTYNENNFNITTFENFISQGLIQNTDTSGVYNVVAYLSFVGNSEAIPTAGNKNNLLSSFISSTMFTESEEVSYTPLVFNIFETIGNIATGFGGLVVSLFTSAFNLIYNNGTLTTLGIFILIGLATGLLIWAFVYIRRLIKIRSK